MADACIETPNRGYGSETSERASRIDLAVVGVATVSVAFYLTYDVPLAVTSVTMFGYMMFVHQPSVRVCTLGDVVAHVLANGVVSCCTLSAIGSRQ